MRRILTLAALLFVISPTLQAGTLVLPAGAQLHVVLETTLNTKKNKVGDPFRARLVLSVFANQREILPVGTSVEGTVVGLRGAGRVSGRAEMQLRPETLFLPDGRDISLGATIKSARNGEDGVQLDPKEGTVKATGKDGINTKKVGVGAAVGAGVGAAAAGGVGAAAGAGAVGAVAVLHQIFKRGKDAVLPAGSELVLEVNRDVSFSDMQEVPPASQRMTGTGEKAGEQR